MYEEDVLGQKTLEEQFDDALKNAFDGFYASLALDSITSQLELDYIEALELAFLAGYKTAGGHPPASP